MKNNYKMTIDEFFKALVKNNEKLAIKCNRFEEAYLLCSVLDVISPVSDKMRFILDKHCDNETAYWPEKEKTCYTNFFHKKYAVLDEETCKELNFKVLDFYDVDITEYVYEDMCGYGDEPDDERFKEIMKNAKKRPEYECYY